LQNDEWEYQSIIVQVMLKVVWKTEKKQHGGTRHEGAI
jgi:hypothetical protein